MTLQTINVGTAANDGTGDTERAAWIKANGNFTELYGVGNFKLPKLNFTGDSKSGEPKYGLASAVLPRFPLALSIGTDIGVGGTGSGTINNGLTATARLATMVSTIAADIAAGCVSDLCVTSATNDMSGASGEALTPTQTIANLRKHYNAFKAAGGRYYILMGFDPRSTGNSTWGSSFDKLALQWSLTERDVIFVPTAYHLQDWANSAGDPVGGTTQVAGAVMDNVGLHCKGWGFYRKGLAMEAAMRRIYLPKVPHFPLAGEAYGATRENANFVGANGRARALGGTNSATNGTVNGTPPLGWTLYGDLQGLTISFTAVNSDPLKALYGAGLNDVPVVRMTISGTPGASGNFNLRLPMASATSTDAAMRLGAAFYCNPAGSDPVKGLAWIRLDDVSFTAGANAKYVHFIGTTYPEGSLVGSDILVQIADGLYSMESNGAKTGGQGSGGTTGPNLRFTFFGGQAVSGTIDLIGLTMNLENALVAAAA